MLRSRAQFVLVLALVIPPSAQTQGLAVSPNCGSRLTHFIVSGAGWPYPPKPCPDSCLTEVAIFFDADAVPFYVAPNCTTSFVLDLQDFPGLLHNRASGNHTLRGFGYYECMGGPVYDPPALRAACIELRDTAGDPWDTLRVTPDSAAITIRLKPGGACDVPLCDSLHFVQVIRMRGIDTLGTTHNLSFAEQYAFDTSRAGLAANRDARVTPAGYSVDVPFGTLPPYATYPQTFGRTGNKLQAMAQEAALQDAPQRSDFSYPGGIQAIVLEFELNALCTAGEGQGQWLGQCTWAWRRNKGAQGFTGTCIPGSCTRGLPSPLFRAALDLYLQRTGRTVPVPSRPSQGVTACP